mgnify:FL=1
MPKPTEKPSLGAAITMFIIILYAPHRAETLVDAYFKLGTFVGPREMNN